MTVEEKPWGHVIVDDAGEVVGKVVKDRREYVKDTDWSLEPDSLVGSWFHVFDAGELIWQGVIVGQPATDRYLCQIDVLEQGTEQVQRVFSLDTILGLGEDGRRVAENAIGDQQVPVIAPALEWRLYDSEQKAQAAFANWASCRALSESREARA